MRASAQSVSFSQFLSSPLIVNPAYTGQIEGDWRFSSLYRTQGYFYSQPLNTVTLSYDRPVTIAGKQLGLGVLYLNDYSGGQTVPAHKLYLSVGSSVALSDKAGLGIGLQFGYVNKRLSYSDMTFPEQYDRNTGGFNNNLPLSENFTYSNSSYFDMAFGVLWSYNTKAMQHSAGLALNHVNQPRDNFLEQDIRLKIKTNLHYTMKYRFNKQYFVLPRFFANLHNKASVLFVGSNVGYDLKNKESKFKSVSLGVYYRSNIEFNINTLVFETAFNWNSWFATMSFDFDASSKSTSNVYSQAFELSVMYELPSTVLKKTTVPWIRY